MSSGGGRLVRHLVEAKRQVGVKEVVEEHPCEHLAFPTPRRAAPVNS
jgi:hypothetical protein